MEKQVRVNTEKLKEKSSEWTEVVEAAGNEFRNAGAIMENIRAGFWAEPIVFMQKAFEQLIERGCRQTEELCAHMEKLFGIAEGYEEAEKENELAVRDN